MSPLLPFLGLKLAKLSQNFIPNYNILIKIKGVDAKKISLKMA
jgi:hypothetical protein